MAAHNIHDSGYKKNFQSLIMTTLAILINLLGAAFII